MENIIINVLSKYVDLKHLPVVIYTELIKNDLKYHSFHPKPILIKQMQFWQDLYNVSDT